MPGVWEAVCVRGDAVQSQVRRGGTSQTLSSGDGLTRKPISDCVVELFGTVEEVFGLRRRSRDAVSRLHGCRCVRYACRNV